ncbi:hypothetical protein T439DRAFT_376214 [Meredithblackwellia eburnea MCA 4105]
MTRGNQREHDRERAAKKLAANKKGEKISAGQLKSRQESDAEIMRKKQVNPVICPLSDLPLSHSLALLV